MNKIPKKKELIFYPSFDKIEDLHEIIGKISWYVPNRENIKIFFKTSINVNENLLLNKNNLPYWMNLIHLNTKNIIFFKPTFRNNLEFIFKLLKSSFFKIILRKRDIIIVYWKKSNNKIFNNLIRKLFLTRIIDNTISSYQSDINLLNIGNNSSEREKIDKIENSKFYFSNFSKELRNKFKKSYIFTRGRSIELSLLKNLDDGIRIVCNSVLASEKLMNHIKPHFIVAVDHAWYFGCSNFSQVFLKDVFNFLSKNDCFFIIPAEVKWLIDIYYPKYKNKIIGIPYNSKTYNLNLLKNFTLFGNVGIMQEVLIPLASSLSDEIIIFGADGKNSESKNNDKFSYIYKYSDLACYPKKLVDEFIQSRPGYYEYANKKEFENNFNLHLRNLINLAIRDGKIFKLAAKSSHESFKDLEIIK